MVVTTKWAARPFSSRGLWGHAPPEKFEIYSSRKYPYSPHRKDWNFLGGGGFYEAKKFKEMYEA